MQHLYNWFANHKTTSIVFFLGILFDVHFVSFRCEGAIFLDGNKTRVVSPGSNVEIKWTFDDDVDLLIARVWHYATKDEELASIFRKGSVLKTNSTLSTGVEFNEKGTMVLRNVDDSYNGTYSFQVSVTGSAGDISSVDVFVTGPLNMSVCSSAITVNESSNVACMCKAERDNTPEAPSVTWYDEDGNQISGVGEGMKELNLNNIKRNQAGRYPCKADSYGLKQENSVQVNVNYKPTVTKFAEFTKKPRKSGETATIECEADGQPEPTYEIIFGGRVISTDKKFTFKVNDTVIGEYFCNATNILGTVSDSTPLTYYVPTAEKTSTPKSPTFKTPGTASGKTSTPESPTFKTSGTVNSKPNSNKADCGTVVIWHIVVSLVAGIIIGILFSYLVVWSRRRFGKRKPRSKPEPQTAKDNSVYQDLDLTKMSSEDNYQSLRGNDARNDAGPEQDSTYTELSKTRDDEDNYQALF